MSTFRVEFRKELCIGAGPCVAAAPDVFVIDEDDKYGKADIVPTRNPTIGGQNQSIVVGEEELEKMLDAAQVCPVVAISVIEVESGKTLYPE